MLSVRPLEVLADTDIDLVAGGSPSIYVGSTNVSVTTVIGVTAVGAIVQIGFGSSKESVSITGLKAYLHL